MALGPEGRRLFWGTGEYVAFDSLEPQSEVKWGRGECQVLAFAFDSSGHKAAIGCGRAKEAENLEIHVLDLESDLESGESQTLSLAESDDSADPGNAGVWDLRFAPDGSLFSAGMGGVRRWNLADGSSETIQSAVFARIDLSQDGRTLVVGASEKIGTNVLTELTVYDFESGGRHTIESHGRWVVSVDLDDRGQTLATGDAFGVVRVGPATGEEPHLLFGHEGVVISVTFSRDGRSLASAGMNEIRIWPVPDRDQTPLHALPIGELIDRLGSLSNIRIKESEEHDTGWTYDRAPFPGWETVPTW